ncbi:MAG: CRISPR-associated protein Csm3 [Candidatus Aenigmatarchaeota archaeon]|nr:MAG: CRISPR-associated protein Csm3 [Candidatus Aenigmarchaeota archaeon]
MTYWGNDLDRIRVIIDVQGFFVNKTPLRIGIGRTEKIGVDLPILRIRDAAGTVKPLIPGSSLKGVFRSYLENIARQKYPELWICNPFNNEDKLVEDEKDPCLICQIMGGGGRRKRLASHVYVYDAYPEGKVETLFITRTAIDRVRGSVRSGALFKIEAVPPLVKWKFWMRIMNIDFIDEVEAPPPEDELRDKKIELLRELLRAFAKGEIRVGAMSSVGYGVIKLEPEKTRVIKSVLGAEEHVSELSLKELLAGWFDEWK